MPNFLENTCILTFDVEEWYHGSYPGYSYDMIDKSLVRVVPMMVRILEALAAFHATATFFVLGEIAETHPEIVKMIIDGGHEVASHGYGHIRADVLGEERFREDMVKAKAILESLAMTKIVGYRAPNFSINPKKTLWAYKILKELGFEYDSSIFPARAYYGGSPKESRFIGKIFGIEEFPLSCMDFRGARLAFSGGFYFRLYPKWFIRKGINSYWEKSQIPVFYLHPKDLDAKTPSLPLGFIKNLAHKWRCKSAFDKFWYFLKNCKFISIADFRDK